MPSRGDPDRAARVANGLERDLRTQRPPPAIFRPFAAWGGDEIVAAANLFLRGEVGSLNSAATLPQHRNEGAQTALLVARAREAADAGCTYLVAEAVAPDGSTNSSLTNMLRLGFRPLYERQNWVWRPAS